MAVGELMSGLTWEWIRSVQFWQISEFGGLTGGGITRVNSCSLTNIEIQQAAQSP